jgi:hypothetical protein
MSYTTAPTDLSLPFFVIGFLGIRLVVVKNSNSSGPRRKSTSCRTSQGLALHFVIGGSTDRDYLRLLPMRSIPLMTAKV